MHYKVASEIMGKNFFGPDEWRGYFQEELSDEEIRLVEDFPWSAEFLESYQPVYRKPYWKLPEWPLKTKDRRYEQQVVSQSHFAFLGRATLYGKPLTTVQWKNFSFTPIDLPYLRERIEEEWLSEKTCAFRWYLMFLGPVTLNCGLIHDPWGAQKRDIPSCLGYGGIVPEYETPYAVEEVAKYTLHHMRHGRYPWDKLCRGFCADYVSEDCGYGGRTHEGRSEVGITDQWNYKGNKSNFFGGEEPCISVCHVCVSEWNSSLIPSVAVSRELPNT